MQVGIIGELCEGSSVRSIEHVTGVHRETIMRLSVRVGRSLVPRPLEKVLLNIFHWKCFRRILRYAELPAARLAAHSG